MTIHSAKGLEFDCVFICGLEEGLFPHENSSSDLDGLEEERRLMYVAITRAKKRLYLSFSQTRTLPGQTRYNVKSRFFDELPESALRWITPRNQSLARASRASTARPGCAVRGALDRRHRPRRAAATASPRSYRRRRHMASGPGRVSSTPSSAKASCMTIEGSGDDARAQVNFGRHGMKWLALSIAKLTPVD